MTKAVEDGGEVAVVAIASIDAITRRGGDIRVAISPRTVGSRHHILGEAVLRPGESIAEHVHDYGEESLFVVRGSGELRAEGRQYPLGPGLVVFAPRGTSHAIDNTGTEELVLVFASAPLAPSPDAGHRETAGDAPAAG